MSEAAPVRIRRFTGEDRLPGAYADFFLGLEKGDATCGLAWLDNFRRGRVLPGSQFRLYALEETAQGRPLMCLPAVYSRLYAAHPRARVVHFLQPDGDAYEPIALPEAAGDACVSMLFAFLGGEDPRCEVLRFSPLDPQSPFAAGLIRTLREMRWPRRVEHMPPERYLAIAGGDHAQIMKGRPPALRARLEAAARSLLDTGRASFRLISDAADVGRAWSDYCAILGEDRLSMDGDAPDYIEGVMRVASGAGTLRVGFLDLDGAPASVQVWRLSGAGARCLRLWTNPARSEPGLSDLLTAYMTRRLIDDERAGALYFGPVTESFAADWASAASPRIEVIAFNPRTVRGVRGAIRHLAVGALRAAWRRGRRALSG